jgi:catechol 2,3-dioxygenase-like lactoylglutathione lyase family enzyme
MFTYVCLGTNDPERAARFYDAVLGAPGHRRCEVSNEWQEAGGRGLGPAIGAGASNRRTA